MIFGNPRPPRACSRGATSSTWSLPPLSRLLGADRSPICVGELTEMVRKFWDEITLLTSASLRKLRPASRPKHARPKFFRERGSRGRRSAMASICHRQPHVSAEHVKGERSTGAQARHDLGGAQSDHTYGNFGSSSPYLHRDHDGHEGRAVPAGDRGREG